MQVSVNIDIDEKEISNKVEGVLNKAIREKVKEFVEDCIAKDYEHFIRHHSCAEGFYDKMQTIFEQQFTDCIQEKIWDEVNIPVYRPMRQELDRESFEIGWEYALWMYENINSKDLKAKIQDDLFERAGRELASRVRHDYAHYKKLIEVLENERTTT